MSKDFKTILKTDVKRILAKIDSLTENPQRDGAIKLSGQNLYRIRQGLYRIIYEIRGNELVV